MGFAIKVKTLLTAKEMTMSDLAERMEPKTTQQNISAKLRKDNLTERDLLAIAKACDATYEGYFVLKDGRKI